MTNLLLNDQLKPCWLPGRPLTCITAALVSLEALPELLPALDTLTTAAPWQNKALKCKCRAKTGPSLTRYLGASHVTVRLLHPLSRQLNCQTYPRGPTLANPPSEPKNSRHKTSQGLGNNTNCISEGALSKSSPWIGCQCTKSNSHSKGKWKSNDFET